MTRELYHVHVYELMALYETDVMAETEDEARALALKEAETTTKWQKPDNNRLALSFKERFRRLICDH
jgi:hypothetical protein